MTARRALLVVTVLVLAGCVVQPSAPRPAAVAQGPPDAATTPVAPAPGGAVTVAVPGPPATWWARDDGDVAARDLAALWGLPLLRVDELGRPRAGLARAARVVPGSDDWAVEVDLAAGEWSDGRPVVAADVVATAAALSAARPASWSAFVGADAVDRDTVRLRFDRPFARWWVLLSEAPGVLPAHVLHDGGLAAWDDDVPVSAGPFVLAQRVPGVSSTWRAHAAGPLGAPRLASLEVLVVPDVDVALGLLADGRTDAVVGHLALDPNGRVAEVPRAVLSLPFGGTTLELAWDPAGGPARDLRRAAAAASSPGAFVDGVLRDVGRPASGVLPGTLPAVRPDGALGSADVRVAVTRTVEPLGLLARLVRRDLARAGIDVQLLRLEPPAHLPAAPESDGALREVRRGPLPSAAAALAEAGLDPGPGVAADARGRGTSVASGVPRSSGPWHDVEEALADAGARIPLADVAPLHAWAPQRVAGLSPSAWPGLAFWDVQAWHVP